MGSGDVYKRQAFGSVTGSAKYAVKVIREKGIKVGLFRPKTAWPFPTWRIEELDSKNVIEKFIVIEVNMGQVYHVVKEHVKNADVIHIPYAPGYVPEPSYILSHIEKLCRG